MKNRQIDLSKPTLVDWQKVEPRFAQVWQSGRLTLGPFTEQFEQAAAKLMQVEHVVAVNSCTSGLMLVVRALNLTGEVILPSFTWASTGHALVWNGLTPVFADITPGAYTLDPTDVAKRITEKTSAIFTANAFGLYPDIDALQQVADETGVPLVCDSAQAIGATYKGRVGGGLCHAEIFSLSPTKVITAVEGGLIATNDGDLARQVRNMRDYGKSADGADVESFGLSARISEFHSIVGLANLDVIEQLLQARQALVDRYRNQLADIPGLSFQEIPAGWRSSFNYFVIFLDPSRYDRDEIWRRMTTQNVQTKRYFYPPLHRLRSYAGYPPPQPPLQATERAADTALALPIYSHLSTEEVDQVCARLKSILS
ncbi:MAG: DegT/DnrJ/EryC1/StrS family aminotransferase [Alphaproteobacteria bacterium]